MPTSDYKIKDGSRVPGVTSVIGSNLGWNKNPLMWWAWREGKEGRNFRETSKAACDAGTICHAMVEAELKGRNIEAAVEVFEFDDPIFELAETGYLSFLDGKTTTNLRLLKLRCIWLAKNIGSAVLLTS